MVWKTTGFDRNKKLFSEVIKNDNFSHAYLFSGQEMIGKKTFALELANKMLGDTAIEYSDAQFLNNPDILFIDAINSESGQTIAIEEVRRIKKFIFRSPYVGKYKFIIINDAHLMTTEAQNALLKVLEEPNASSILILVSANSESLLPTIFSRCQEIKFFPHKKEVIDGILTDVKLSKINKEFLAVFVDGRIGLIKQIIDKESFDEVEDAVKKIMHLIKADINERLNVAQKLTDEKNKADLPRLVLYWMLYLRTRIGEPRAQKMLKGLLVLNEIVNKPQYNQRLALENFLVSL
ncbi:MAG: AAA family ATPase [Patescibacteria group bacterium]